MAEGFSTVSPPRWLIEPLFPAEQVHLISGPSGSGKTRLVLGVLIPCLERGEEFLGHAVEGPHRIAYLSCDRPESDWRLTCEGLGRDPDSIPHLSLPSTGRVFAFTSAYRRIREVAPDADVIVLDALGVMLKDLRDYQAVYRLLSQAVYWCERDHVTIFALTHTSKRGERDQYQNPRERAIGSVGWGGFAGTHLTIEEAPEFEGDESRRRVSIHPHHAAPIVLYYRLEEGRFVPATPPAHPANRVRGWLDTVGDREFRLLEAVRAAGVSRHRVKTVLSELIEDGVVERVNRGVYRVLEPSVLAVPTSTPTPRGIAAENDEEDTEIE